MLLALGDPVDPVVPGLAPVVQAALAAAEVTGRAVPDPVALAAPVVRVVRVVPARGVRVDLTARVVLVGLVAEVTAPVVRVDLTARVVLVDLMAPVARAAPVVLVGRADSVLVGLMGPARVAPVVLVGRADSAPVVRVVPAARADSARVGPVVLARMAPVVPVAQVDRCLRMSSEGTSTGAARNGAAHEMHRTDSARPVTERRLHRRCADSVGTTDLRRAYRR